LNKINLLTTIGIRITRLLKFDLGTLLSINHHDLPVLNLLRKVAQVNPKVNLSIISINKHYSDVSTFVSFSQTSICLFTERNYCSFFGGAIPLY